MHNQYLLTGQVDEWLKEGRNLGINKCMCSSIPSWAARAVEVIGFLSSAGLP